MIDFWNRPAAMPGLLNHNAQETLLPPTPGGLLGPDPDSQGPLGGLLDFGEARMPLLLAGLQMLSNSGPSTTPNSLFDGVANAVGMGYGMQRDIDQRSALAGMDLSPQQRQLAEAGYGDVVARSLLGGGGAPDLQTVYQGGEAVQGYFGADGEFVEVGRGPRWESGMPGAGGGGGPTAPRTSGLPPGYMWQPGPDGSPQAAPIPGLDPSHIGSATNEPAAIATYNALLAQGYSEAEASARAFGDRAEGPGDAWYSGVLGESGNYLTPEDIEAYQQTRDTLNQEAGFGATPLQGGALARIQAGDYNSLIEGRVYELPDGRRFRYAGNGEIDPIE